MIKKIIYTISLLLFLCTGVVQAQRETYNWIFGDKAGLTWNTTRNFTGYYVYGGGAVSSKTLTDMPTNITSPLAATQGCFTLSDRKGNLLLFSNGAKLYNGSQAVINSTTDMIGNIDVAQAGILFPYPGKPGKYVAVTTGRWSTDILAYTVIDMKGNSGLGSIESINNSFPSGAGRRGKVGSSVTATRHANGVDYWVIAPGKGSPSYLNIWRFTPNGVEAPDSYPLPASVGVDKANGYIKISPDGKHFVWGTFSDSKLFFGKFDNATGKFSNIRYITGSGGGNEFYGVEFSRSGNYMYVSKTTSSVVSNYLLYAFDFNALINSSNPQDYYQNEMKRISFPSSKGGMPAALQLGPDGRMYISGHAATAGYPTSLYVIENPEQFNNLKIFRLDNFLNGTPMFGLPSFAASWFELKIEGETEFCLDYMEREYTLTISKGVGSEELAYTQWNFGDGTLINDSNIEDGDIQSHMHAYGAAGNYTITITSHKANGEEITAMKQTLAVNVLAIPSFTVTADDVCVGESGTMTVNITGDDFTINWYNNTTDTTPISTGKTYSTGIQNTERTLTFYVEVINASGCSSGRKAVNVTVKTCGYNFIPINPHIRVTH